MIKSADVDKRGGVNAYPKNGDKKHGFFFEPFPNTDSLTGVEHKDAATSNNRS